MGRLGQATVCLVVPSIVLLGPPNWRAWGLVLTGILLTWLVWLVRRLVGPPAELPGNPIHAVLLGIAAILAVHVVHEQRILLPQDGLRGALTLSLLTQTGLLSAAIVFVQGFCGTRGAAEALGTLTGLGLGLAGWMDILTQAPAQPAHRQVVVGLCLAGACLLLCPLFDQRSSAWLHARGRTALHQVGLAGRFVALVGCALAGIILLTRGGWPLWVWAICSIGSALGGYYLRTRVHGRLRVGSGVLLWLATGGGFLTIVSSHAKAATVLGAGERAFVAVTSADGGAAVLAGTTGILGFATFILGTTGVGLAMLLGRDTEKRAPSGVAALWTAASFLVTGTFLAPVGSVNPGVFGAFAVVWGIGPRLTGWETRLRSRRMMAMIVLMVMLLVDLAPDPGLLTECGQAFGVSDKVMHGVAGFLLALVLAWWLGSHHWWGSVLAFLGSLAAGAAGEVAQLYFSSRNAETADFRAHSAGVVAALVVYLLCFGCRARTSNSTGSPIGPKHGGPSGFRLFLRLAISVPLTTALFGWVVAALGHVILTAGRPLPDVLVPDGYAVTPAARALRVAGLVISDESMVGSSVYAALPSGNLLPCPVTITSNRAHLTLSVSGLRAGPNSIRVAGVPFGALSHVRQTVNWHGLPSDRTVQVLDAQSLLQWQREDAGTVRRLVRTLGNQGSLVSLFVGSTSDYLRTRELLRESFPDLPCLAQLRAPNSRPAAVALLQRALAQGEGKPPVRLLTAEAGLALEARRRLGATLEAWLVTEEPAPNDRTRSWRTHYRSIGAVLDALHSAVEANQAPRQP